MGYGVRRVDGCVCGVNLGRTHQTRRLHRRAGKKTLDLGGPAGQRTVPVQKFEQPPIVRLDSLFSAPGPAAAP